MVPVVFIHINHAALAQDSHIVEEDVESAKLPHRCVDHGAAVRGTGDVALKDRSLAALLANCRERFLGLTQGEVHQQHLSAFAGEQGGCSLAGTDPRATGPRSGNDGHLSFEPESWSLHLASVRLTLDLLNLSPDLGQNKPRRLLENRRRDFSRFVRGER